MRESIDMNWKPLNSVVNNNILIYEGYNPDVPLRAWAVKIPTKDNSIRILGF